MCFAPCDVARFDFACDRVSEKAPYDLGRYIAGMNLARSNQGALIAVSMIVKDWEKSAGVEMLRGADTATPFKRSLAKAQRIAGYDALISSLPPFAEDPNDAWETAHYLAPVIFHSREPSLVAAFLAELLGYRGSQYDDYCFALLLIDGVIAK